MNAVVLAFIGDAVHTLATRTRLVCECDCKTDKLHTMTSREVKASAQAELFDTVKDNLTDDEKAIYMRGRNAHTATTAKNATLADYKKATGFEALLGYLYLTGNADRLNEILKQQESI